MGLDRTFVAWAVKAYFRGSENPGEPFLAGRLYFGAVLDRPHLDGQRTALFRTREEARLACREKSDWYTQLTPVKVRVEISEA